MKHLYRRGGLLGIATAIAATAVVGGVQPVTSEETLPHVTSDTREYCLHLLDRVSAMVNVAAVPPPHEVMDLSAEGQRMCDHGHMRSGITRLRRALVLLKNKTD